MQQGISACLARGDEDPAVHAIILRGSGEKHFSAGGDLKKFFSSSKPMEVEDRLRAFWYPGLYDIPGRSKVYDHRVSTPVIGAVVGFCLGSALMILGMQ